MNTYIMSGDTVHLKINIKLSVQYNQRIITYISKLHLHIIPFTLIGINTSIQKVSQTANVIHTTIDTKRIIKNTRFAQFTPSFI